MLNDELSDLAIFTAVADARSFTRAAAKVGKSQSALSHLYYPNRRHPSPAFAALLEELRANSHHHDVTA